MDIKLAKFLVEVSEHCGNQECDLREDYSGRGMYGKTTAGIVVNNPGQLISDTVAYIRDRMTECATIEDFDALGESLPEEFYSMRQDNMGMDMILY